jgi:hypothetical protein
VTLLRAQLTLSKPPLTVTAPVVTADTGLLTELGLSCRFLADRPM